MEIVRSTKLNKTLKKTLGLFALTEKNLNSAKRCGDVISFESNTSYKSSARFSGYMGTL